MSSNRKPSQGGSQRSDGSGRNDRKRNKRKGKPKSKAEPAVDPAKFWGDPELLPEPISSVASTPEVTALVSSLGRIPIPPHETAAEHSFQLVYQRAAMLASALAAANGLDTSDDTAG